MAFNPLEHRDAHGKWDRDGAVKALAEHLKGLRVGEHAAVGHQADTSLRVHAMSHNGQRKFTVRHLGTLKTRSLGVGADKAAEHAIRLYAENPANKKRIGGSAPEPPDRANPFKVGDHVELTHEQTAGGAGWLGTTRPVGSRGVIVEALPVRAGDRGSSKVRFPDGKEHYIVHDHLRKVKRGAPPGDENRKFGVTGARWPGYAEVDRMRNGSTMDLNGGYSIRRERNGTFTTFDPKGNRLINTPNSAHAITAARNHNEGKSNAALQEHAANLAAKAPAAAAPKGRVKFVKQKDFQPGFHRSNSTRIDAKHDVLVDGKKVGEIHKVTHFHILKEGRIQVGKQKDFTEFQLHKPGLGGDFQFSQHVRGKQHFDITSAKAEAVRHFGGQPAASPSRPPGAPAKSAFQPVMVGGLSEATGHIGEARGRVDMAIGMHHTPEGADANAGSAHAAVVKAQQSLPSDHPAQPHLSRARSHIAAAMQEGFGASSTAVERLKRAKNRLDLAQSALRGGA